MLQLPSIVTAKRKSTSIKSLPIISSLIVLSALIAPSLSLGFSSVASAATTCAPNNPPISLPLANNIYIFIGDGTKIPTTAPKTIHFTADDGTKQTIDDECGLKFTMPNTTNVQTFPGWKWTYSGASMNYADLNGTELVGGVIGMGYPKLSTLATDSHYKGYAAYNSSTSYFVKCLEYMTDPTVQNVQKEHYIQWNPANDTWIPISTQLATGKYCNSLPIN